jgi:hypothetical protein
LSYDERIRDLTPFFGSVRSQEALLPEMNNAFGTSSDYGGDFQIKAMEDFLALLAVCINSCL